MLIGIAGGSLQGTEVAYLAKKAGYRTLLADHRNDVPATGICDRFEQIDITRKEELTRALNEVDLVIPALENQEALDVLWAWSREIKIPMAFDPDAYAVSSSKIASDRLFHDIRVPAPVPWPDCGFPIVVKPSNASGSDGVKILSDQGEMQNQFSGQKNESEWVVQQYLPGPSYSIEIVGTPSGFTPLQVTDLHMDRQYDCKRVTAPTTLSRDKRLEFEALSIKIADQLHLNGLMDVEVVLHDNTLKVLEIDARFPSQTPMAVFHSKGYNMIRALVELFTETAPDLKITQIPARAVIVEHIRVTSNEIVTEGEHIMTNCGPLKIIPGFFGTDEAVTSYVPGNDTWVASMIWTGSDMKDARRKRELSITAVCHRFNIDKVVDQNPPFIVTGDKR